MSYKQTHSFDLCIQSPDEGISHKSPLPNCSYDKGLDIYLKPDSCLDNCRTLANLENSFRAVPYNLRPLCDLLQAIRKVKHYNPDIDILLRILISLALWFDDDVDERELEYLLC